MNRSNSRRIFLRNMLTVPALAAAPSLSFANSTKAVSEEFGHKFKMSLNLFSFNALLKEGKVDLFHMLDFCAEYNFDAIDPTGYYFPGYPEVPSDEFINQFKRKAFLLGLDISGTGVRNNFSTPDESSRKKDIEMVKAWIKAAAKLGIPNVRVFAGHHAHEGYSRDQVFEWMARDLRTCCDYGKEYGVICAIQNHNGFLKTADDIDRIFEMVDSEWLGLNLDIGSYRTGDPFNQIKQTIKYAVTWQIKENMWIEGVETPTDLTRLMKIIKNAGYRGYLPIETLGPGDPYKKVPALLEKVKKAIHAV